MLALFALLNLRTLDWPFGIIDTPILIAQAILYSPLDYFTSPDAYRFLSHNNFTPLASLSWDIDYTLFDLDTRLYRVHQLLALLTMLGLFYVLVLTSTRSVALATLSCFTAMTLPGTLSSLDVMVNRHYIEGMVFAIAATLCYLRYLERRHLAWLAGALICYALAVLAKEVYLPLPGILFFLGDRTPRQRLATITPFALVLAGYLSLRWYMIGGAGGYGGNPPGADNNALTLLLWALLDLLSVYTATSLALLALAALLLATCWRSLRRPARLAIAIGVIGAVLPLGALAPLVSAGMTQPRWLLVPSILLLWLLVWLSRQARSQWLAALTCATVFVTGLLGVHARLTAEPPALAVAPINPVDEILRSDDSQYLLFSRFAPLAAENYSVWSYVAKLRNGRWGTLPIVHPGQAPYHDLNGKTPLPLGRRARNPAFVGKPMPQHPAPIASIERDRPQGLTRLHYQPGLKSKRCSVYLFSKHNGLVLPEHDCAEWLMPQRELKFLLRKAGIDARYAHFAVWSQDRASPWRSAAYPVRRLLGD